MLFFALQAPLLLAENLLRTWCRQAGIHVPRPLRVAATLLLLYACELLAPSVCWAALLPWKPVQQQFSFLTHPCMQARGSFSSPTWRQPGCLPASFNSCGPGACRAGPADGPSLCNGELVPHPNAAFRSLLKLLSHAL